MFLFWFYVGKIIIILIKDIFKFVLVNVCNGKVYVCYLLVIGLIFLVLVFRFSLMVVVFLLFLILKS